MHRVQARRLWSTSNSEVRDTTYQINNLPEVNLHRAFLEVGVIGGVVNEFTEFTLPHFGGTVSKDEQERVNGI